MAALAHSGERVELVSTFRSYDADGDRERQEALRVQGESLGRALASQWQGLARGERPDLWFIPPLPGRRRWPRSSRRRSASPT
jgi:hypothetical protein